MRKLTRSILATTAVVGLLAIPVTGAVGADNAVSFTVDANSAGLSIDNTGTGATLSSGGTLLALNAATVTGTLPATTVTDERGTLLGGWTVSVVATGDWQNQSDTSVVVSRTAGRAYIDATSLANLTGDVLAGAVSGMTIAQAELNVTSTNNLGTAYTLLRGTTPLGNGNVTYTPTVDVDVPANTPAGTYTATVRQTVS